MARVFITGSADGLGRAAAQTLLNDGHEVVVHARNRDRLTAVRDSWTGALRPSSGTCPTSRRRAFPPAT
jgi:NAD(P)-dependent dehydrogenase (short-subunit alcohol dehydrogenase family)